MTRFSKLLIAGATFALLAPAAVGAMLLNGHAEVPDESQMQVVASSERPQLGTLGRASAVAWIRAGHVSAVP